MCHQSPAKVLRNVKRITRFLDMKKLPKVSPQLSTVKLQEINIEPNPPPNLSVCQLNPISINTRPTKLSFRRFQSTEIVPGVQNDDHLFSSTYIDGSSLTTTFICHFCNDDYSFNSSWALRTHARTDHTLELYQTLKHKPPFQPSFEQMY